MLCHGGASGCRTQTFLASVIDAQAFKYTLNIKLPWRGATYFRKAKGVKRGGGWGTLSFPCFTTSTMCLLLLSWCWRSPDYDVLCCTSKNSYKAKCAKLTQEMCLFACHPMRSCCFGTLVVHACVWTSTCLRVSQLNETFVGRVLKAGVSRQQCNPRHILTHTHTDTAAWRPVFLTALTIKEMNPFHRVCVYVCFLFTFINKAPPPSGPTVTLSSVQPTHTDTVMHWQTINPELSGVCVMYRVGHTFIDTGIKTSLKRERCCRTRQIHRVHIWTGDKRRFHKCWRDVELKLNFILPVESYVHLLYEWG